MQKQFPQRSWWMNLLLVGSVWTTLPTNTVVAFSSPSAVRSTRRTTTFHRVASSTSSSIDMEDPLVAVFSDVDGTLVHYPEGDDRLVLEQTSNDDNKILKLPPSATGMQGVISSGTLVKCQELRQSGAKLVLVSGMRTSTLLTRLPYLPQADAYCAEGGGRIFYRVPLYGKENIASCSFVVHPKPYDGAWPSDLQPFTLQEDPVWRQKMEQLDAAGSDGFIGNEIDDDAAVAAIPVKDRKGALWEYARELEAQGYVLDVKGYASNFRVNKKQQTSEDVKEHFQQSLLAKTTTCPPGIATSTNLGCVDFYPAESGKRNCCKYLANKFSSELDYDLDAKDPLAEHCVCLCDDDNDSEMAMAVNHAFIPGVGSTSMKRIIQTYPDQFSRTGEDHQKVVDGMVATERALELVLELSTTCENRSEVVEADVCLLNIEDAHDSLKYYDE